MILIKNFHHSMGKNGASFPTGNPESPEVVVSSDAVDHQAEGKQGHGPLDHPERDPEEQRAAIFKLSNANGHNLP